MAMDQDQFARELEHALRRVRSTGDIELERPSRQRGSIRITVDPSTGQRNIRFAQPDNNDNPQRRLSTPATAHTRDTQLRSFTFPPLNADPPPPPPPNPPRARRRAQRPVPPGFRGKVMVFFGLAGPNAKARSQLIAIVWKAVFGFVQYVVIITLLAIAAHRQSPTMPGISEWQACSKPLGAWDCIWLVRVALGCGMGYWDWRRNLALDRMERGGGASGHGDTEAQAGRASIGAANRRNTSNLTPSSNAQAQGQNSNNTQTETPLPYSHLFRRLNILTNTLSMVWFLAAHIFVYSSVNTCRHSSPHLWWITFGILCILYLMLLEIFLIGLLIFILGPILYLFYNIVLLCLGRHPLQHVGEVNADIKKIPKSVVDKIPLVLYIPPPPEEDEPTKDGAEGITAPSPAHLYPPGPSSPTKPKEKRKYRFAFLRRSKASSSSLNSKSASTKKGGKGKTEGKDGEEEDEEAKTWEDNWVPGEYPFVRLEGNRAACAICLMDFDEPERKNKDKSKNENKDEVKGTTQEEQKAGSEGGAEAVGPSALDTIREEHGEIQETKTTSPVPEAQEQTQMQVGEVTPAEAQRLNLDLTLEDAGEGAQPLRLLGCGHVFHKTCVDPWLTDVSGRCPVCQRPVEVPDNAGKKKRRRGFGRRRNSS